MNSRHQRSGRFLPSLKHIQDTVAALKMLQQVGTGNPVTTGAPALGTTPTALGWPISSRTAPPPPPPPASPPTSLGKSGPAQLGSCSTLPSPLENMITPLNVVSSINYNYVFSLKICVEISGKSYEALVDTGSTVSLIEEAVVTGDPVSNINITLKTAGKGEGLFSCYKVNQGFGINSKFYEHEFLVVKSLNLPPISLILGYDLISKLKFIIKAQEKTGIILDGNVIPTIPSPLTINIVASEKERSSFAVNVSDIVVPAHVALCVNLKLIGKELQDGTQIALIPTQEFSDVLSSDVIVEVCNGFVSACLYNLSAKLTIYPAKATFAHCKPVTITENIAAVSVCKNREQNLLHLVSLKTSPECFLFMRDIASVYSSLFVLDDEEPTGFTDIMPKRHAF